MLARLYRKGIRCGRTLKNSRSDSTAHGRREEVLLAAHHWEGSWVSMQDLRKGPPPDNGLE
jgi:hypothetical protein